MVDWCTGALQKLFVECLLQGTQKFSVRSPPGARQPEVQFSLTARSATLFLVGSSITLPSHRVERLLAIVGSIAPTQKRIQVAKK
jgi:hypothetical protein